MQKKIVIIGAGPCGLGAAYRLKELGHENFTVIEKSPIASGLATTITDENGFLWDMGGHVVFSHYQYFDKLLDICNQEWSKLERVCFIWQFDRWIPYPFQNNIHRLPQQELQHCLQGLIDINTNGGNGKKHPKPKNFYEWLENGFGQGIMDVFLVPYNKKVWAYHPTEMNVEWMGERVATVDLKKVVSNVVTGQDELGWGPNNIFRFPLHGGSGSIFMKLKELIPDEKFQFNKTVVEINTEDKLIHMSDGTKESYDEIISTMPLDLMCLTVKGNGLEEWLPDKVKDFRYSSTHVVGIGIEGFTPKHLENQCWMYFPEDNCPFYRVTVFSNYSPYHVPKPGLQWSLMAEVSESCNRPCIGDKDAVIEAVIQGFLNTKLLSPEDKIVDKFHIRLEHGYPTPFFGRDELCNPIFNSLEDHKIKSRGRFGAWKYEVSNQDHSLMQGVEAADNILYGSEECTFRFPGYVNDRKWKNIGRSPKDVVPEVEEVNPHDIVAAIRAKLSS